MSFLYEFLILLDLNGRIKNQIIIIILQLLLGRFKLFNILTINDYLFFKNNIFDFKYLFFRLFFSNLRL